MACADLVMNAPLIPGSRLAEEYPHEHLEDVDKFACLHPDTNWRAGLEHAEKIGLGTRDYELIKV